MLGAETSLGGNIKKNLEKQTEIELPLNTQQADKVDFVSLLVRLRTPLRIQLINGKEHSKRIQLIKESLIAVIDRKFNLFYLIFILVY